MNKWPLARVFGRLLSTFAGILLVTSGATAQVYWQPQPAPLATAENEPWFRLGEPIAFEGYVYYPAGARVYFDGNVMVRSGAFRGIPIYTDTTLESYSRIFVPVGGMLQPYERRRTGDAAGTTGSRAPSFPVTIAGEPSEEPPLIGAEELPRTPSMTPARTRPAAEPEGTSGIVTPRDVIEAGLRPKGLNEVYVNFDGARWKASGRAVPLSADQFEQIGEVHGFPVYIARGQTGTPRVIYLPSRAGLIAPYERAGSTPKY